MNESGKIEKSKIKRRPIGIWIVVIFAALFALPQLKNIAEVLLLPGYQHWMGNVPKLVFSGAGFFLAVGWAIQTYKMGARAAFYAKAFFVWSLLPFFLAMTDMVMNQTENGAIHAFLPPLILWCIFLLSLVIWTRKLVNQ